MTPSLANLTHELLACILALPGDKQITIVGASVNGHQTFDVTANGEVGYHPLHREHLISLLKGAIRKSGAVTVRQFLKIKSERVMPNGKKVWIPEKNLYGVRLGSGRYEMITGEAMKQSYETDCETGLPLPKDPSVHFVAWPASANR